MQNNYKIISEKQNNILLIIFITVIFSLLSIIWIFFNQSLPLFDSSRFYLRLIHLIKSNIVDSIFNKNILTNSNESLWLTLISFISQIFRISNFKNIIITNTLFSYLALNVSFILIIKKYFNEKVIFHSTIFLFLIPSFFHQTKILMPEILSISLIILNFYFIELFANKLTFKSLFGSFLILIMGYFFNATTILYCGTLFILAILRIIIYKKNIRLTYRILCYLFIVFIVFLIKKYFTTFNPLNFHGSWTDKPLTKFSIITAIFWQFYGFINKTCGFFPFILLIVSYLFAKPRKRNILILIKLLFLFLILLALFKPYISTDFYVTGYRYQLPLLLLSSLIFGTTYVEIKSIKIKFAIYLILILIFLETLLQSIPQLPILNKRIYFNITSSKMIKSFFSWDGSLTIFDTTNSEISGGGLSKLTLTKSSKEKLILEVTDYLNKIENGNDIWITFLSKSEKGNHLIQNAVISINKNWIVQSDQKNPFFSKKILNELEILKKNIPEFFNLKNSTVILRMSKYVLFHKTNENPENRLKDIYNNINYEFETILPTLTFLKKFKIFDEEILIYKNPLLFHDKFKKIISKDSVLKNDFIVLSDNKNFPDFFNINNIKNNFKIEHKSSDELQNILQDSIDATLILPHLTDVPQQLLPYVKLHYQRGGHLWFTGDIINVDTPKYDKKVLTCFLSAIGFNLYSHSFVNKKFPLNAKITKNHIFGLEIYNGSKSFNKRHSKGNVFPFRTPLAHSTPLLQIKENNIPIATPVSFTSFFKNPYKHIVKTSRILFYSPNIKKPSEKILRKIIKNFLYPLYLIDLYPSSLIIKNNNKLNLNLETQNKSNEKFNETFHCIINHNKQFKINETISFHPKEIKKIVFKIPENFLKEGFNSFEVTTNSGRFQKLKCGIIKKLENNEKNKSLSLKIINKQLYIKESNFITGVNYYPSNNYDRFWLHPNLFEVHEDFKLMKKLNFKIVRMHYIHSNWYKDFNYYFANNKIEKVNERYNNFDILISVLELAALHELIVTFDLFSLINSDLGSPEGWMDDEKRFTDYKFIEKQNAFLINFLKITKNYSNLTIDLINEPKIAKSYEKEFVKWTKNKIQIIKAFRPDILVTIGFKYPGLPIDKLDYYSIHSDKILKKPILDKPVIIQEFWPVKFNSDYYEIFNFKTIIEQAKKEMYSGIMPFSFITPQNLYRSEGKDEKWESELGTFFRSDKTLKSEILKL